MFEKIVRKLGYIPRKDVRHIKLTDEEISFLLETSFSEADVFDNDFEEGEEKRIFEDMAAIEGIQEYFKKTLSKDIMRFFNAQPGPQMLEIKGAYKRTLYFKKKMGEGDKKAPTKLVSKRYL